MGRPQDNRLLSRLPPAEFERVAAHLSQCDLKPDQILADPYRDVSRVYFPHSGIVSFLVELADGDRVQSGMVGPDGAVGAAQALDNKICLNKIMVRVPGTASFMTPEQLRELSQTIPAFRTLLASHAQFFVGEVQQSVACNAAHSVEERMSRWLLRMHDLVGPQIPLTQELLAEMLAVRRTSVSQIAGKLHEAGAIDYVRGQIHITNPERLKDSVCECHKMVREHYERLFPDPLPA
jgi:CRP-like cAMP-binding protein